MTHADRSLLNYAPSVVGAKRCRRCRKTKQHTDFPPSKNTNGFFYPKPDCGTCTLILNRAKRLGVDPEDLTRAERRPRRRLSETELKRRKAARKKEHKKWLKTPEGRQWASDAYYKYKERQDPDAWRAKKIAEGKVWREKNPERARAIARKAAAKMRKKDPKYWRRWHEAHPEYKPPPPTPEQRARKAERRRLRREAFVAQGLTCEGKPRKNKAPKPRKKQGSR